MADHKPDFPEGYLGPQEGFNTGGLKALSFTNPTIEVSENMLEIKIAMERPYKFTHQLINCRDDKEHNEYVFVQNKDGCALFEIQLPESGWFKLQLFGLPLTDSSKSLPNLYNYAINCTKALHPVYPYPKQYAQWKDGCFIEEPRILAKDSRLRDIKWKVHVPRAKSVALVADGEWHHFENKGGHVFEAKITLSDLRGKDAKITLNANFDTDESKFTTLLEYKLN